MNSSVATMLHPFSIKPPDKLQACEPSQHDEGIAKDEDKHILKPARGRSTSKPKAKNQTTLGQLFNRSVEPETTEIPGHFCQDVCNKTAEQAQHKRRRISLDTFVQVDENGHSMQQDLASQQIEPDALSDNITHPIPQEQVENSADDNLPTAASENPPATPAKKKMLRLNAKGRFSSPISKETQLEATDMAAGQPKRRGRPRKSEVPQPEKHLVVIMRYSAIQAEPGSSTIGQKVVQILSGELVVPVFKKPRSTKKLRTPRKQTKANHPFFDGKKKPAPSIVIASPRKTAAITPGKLRLRAEQERGGTVVPFIPSSESALLKDRLMVKHPGAKEPLWPAKGMTHVTGEVFALQQVDRLPRRKQKHHLPLVADSILSDFAQHLIPEPEPELRPDGFREPRADLRIPEKHIESGAGISMLVAKELVAPVLSGPDDELAFASSQPVTHPALEHMFASIPSHLSGFDLLQGEAASWSQKSAPQSTEQVLQPVKEINVIKYWLKSLAVNAVIAPKDDSAEGRARKRKRKPRPADLNDFIVDEDDDVRSMGTISDNEPSSQSIVQNHVDGLRASNTMLISGPHGCGKTAAVYAVAKELQYRVFEISSSERRSGKDVIDKIGNVTENHIVKSHHNDTDAELSGSEDKERIDAAFKQDLETGRQGKMSAFFKPKQVKPAAIVKAKVIDNVKTAIKKAAKEQQQSLILLEEVDILYKEDKEFWSTILKLVQTSKRPFILTCNDEDLVPVQAMNLHAVLRLVPPTDELAVDYLLLVAAKEGHLLHRNAVASLWRDCTRDLRQSLTMLDFWCRMGVGDIRDGLGWIYQRWPTGSDLDQQGRPLRVVSQNTYQEGMGKEAQDVKAYAAPRTLRAACRIAEALSDIDIFSTKHTLDTTQPSMPDKRRAHFIEGLALLDAPERADFTNLQEQLSDAARAYTNADMDEYTMEPPLTRHAFAAYDMLAYPATSTGMEWSVIDGPFSSIVTEISPYVRQVIRYEASLREHREAIHGPVKKARTTRAARSALEGGQRQLTRREEWWEGSSDMQGVLLTAGNGWHECITDLNEDDER